MELRKLKRRPPHVPTAAVVLTERLIDLLSMHASAPVEVEQRLMRVGRR